ncbi:phosphomannomutase/phosphoglucomutase [Clostridium fungisolvens]|uniref:Phosphomannomutase/phosphoglucomutase n=1 Tax=Clostridium fungisolvens TaxID=1604897 RepID=A0A6V8SEB9_9CLOT|nr:phosphomannomutase/phosphoglucomutase [Clostridium fungisolvens]GFP75171.1 Phosphomannomutase/phosphoglucomutase [Clostridium fungisolvens]
MIEKLKKLQNGTDIRGIAIENSEHSVNFTPRVARFIGHGFFNWLRNKNTDNKKINIAVGIDSRLSGPSIKEEVIDLLINVGCDVYDCGMCTTPAMFMTTIHESYKCDGAIMITASHLPYYYNGLKFFTPQGGCEKEDVREILNTACETELVYTAKGSLNKIDFIEEYSNILVNKIRNEVNSQTNYNEPLQGLKIIVDAGNGAGGFFANKVLKRLGADTEGSQFLNPDGMFPNHIPNPENKEAMKSIRDAVIKSRADLGIIFDTDVDRAAIVSSDGTEINRNSLIALISAIVLEEHPRSIIVTDSVTSNGLRDFITDLGGRHHRFKRGYRNVINESKRINEEGLDSQLAIETSGHAALKENYFLDDGAYLIAKILIKMAKLKEQGKKIESLIKNLKKPLESTEVRVKIKTEEFSSYGSQVISGLRNYVSNIPGWSIEDKNYEGIKINCDKANGDGWLLLRMSLHEPVLPINIESDSKGGTSNILKVLTSFLKKYEELDLSEIERIIKKDKDLILS